MLSADDKSAISELLARASYGYDERDLTMLESCLSESATMSLRIAGGDLMGPFEGRPTIMQLYRDSMASQNDARRHVVSYSMFEISGESVNVISNLTLFATEDGQTRLLTVGLYRDVVTRGADGWCIVQRHVDLDSAY